MIIVYDKKYPEAMKIRQELDSMTVDDGGGGFGDED